MQPILAWVASLQCALSMRVPSGGALHVPPVPGPPAAVFVLVLLRCSATIFQLLRFEVAHDCGEGS